MLKYQKTSLNSSFSLKDSKSKFCDEDETAKHVMCKCEAYAIIRHKYFKKLESVGFVVPCAEFVTGAPTRKPKLTSKKNMMACSNTTLLL